MQPRLRNITRTILGVTLCGAIVATSTAHAATRVPLVIDEPFADRTAVWPITTGVPFPRGKLTNSDRVRLVDDRGQEQPLQVRVSATWDAQRTSIRWLTIDFLAEPGRSYALEFGDDVARKPPPRNLLVSENPLAAGKDKNARVVRAATGSLQAIFSTTGPAALASLGADLNDDGLIGPPEIVARGATQGEHFYTDQNGRRFTSSRDGNDRQIAIETKGPVRACVRVDGFYTGPGGERIARYRTRYHFFAGLPLVKITDEFAIIGSTKGTTIADLGFALDTKIATEKRVVTIDASGAVGNQPQAIPWQADTQAIASFQKIFRHFGNLECEAGIAAKTKSGEMQLGKSDQVGEWLQMADGRSSLTGSLRWMWQQFPKEWEATPDGLVLHLWSPRAGSLDFSKAGIDQFLGPAGQKYLRAKKLDTDRNPLSFVFHAEEAAIQRGSADGLGINKHHEIFLHVGPASAQDEGAEYARLAAQQPIALATGEWNCSTDVFGPLAPRANNKNANLDPSEGPVEFVFDLERRMQDEFGDYGWWLFGAGPHYSYQWDKETGRFFADSRRFEFHTYGKETQLWWNYLRSGERKFYDWAIPSENHWVDIAVAHMPTTIECGWRGGKREQRKIHWRPGEWTIDSPTHYVRHHDRGEAWLRGGAQFWASYHRTLETTTLAYYLTGDERFNDAIEFWRDYFGELGGKTNASADLQPWYKEQAWFREPRPGPPQEPPKSWAALIRDYAPFHSGTRHEMTMFFNVATLYEHTWDPRVGLALKDCADAFLDPSHNIGTWRPQDSSLPANAETPSMGHFWVPALWKYARVSGDTRMPDILARYFAAGYAADPFRSHETVGVYSNTYLGYAYYFTRDARFLPLAVKELENIRAYGQPLAKPEDINARLYNPYAPAQTFAATPRLRWALDAARTAGVRIGPRPLPPQRTAIALHKFEGKPLEVTFWGYEPTLTLFFPAGRGVDLARDLVVKTEKYASDIQPFDQTTPQYEIYLHRVVFPAGAAGGDYVCQSNLELGILDWSTDTLPLWNASRPLALSPGEAVLIPIVEGQSSITLESADAPLLRLRDEGNLLPGKVQGNRVTFEFSEKDKRAKAVRIEIVTRSGWMRIVDRLPDLCWVVPSGSLVAPGTKNELPSREIHLPSIHRDVRAENAFDPANKYVSGQFGSAASIVFGRALHIPDHIVENGVERNLFDERQGTIEFWVRLEHDVRLVGFAPQLLVNNGLLSVAQPNKLKLRDWTHVAFVWAPYRGDPQQTMTYLYIDGLDARFYRSFQWDGYSSPRPSSGKNTAKRLREFILQANGNKPFAIDELRISNVARYADLNVDFGPQQTFNPVRFTPSDKPFEPDKNTLLLMHFDGDLKTAIPAGLNPKWVETK